MPKAKNTSNAGVFKHRKAKVGKKKLAAANVTNTSFKWAVLADVARGVDKAEKRDSASKAEENAVENEERYQELLKHLTAHSADSRKEAVVAISKTAAAAPHLVLRNFGRTLISLAARIPDPEAPVRAVLPLAFDNVLAVTSDASQLDPFSPTVFAYVASALTSLQTNTRLDALATLAVWAKLPKAIPGSAQERLLTALISLLEGQHHSLVASSVLLGSMPPMLELGVTPSNSRQAIWCEC
jgi:ATP-dependent DNA ligase